MTKNDVVYIDPRADTSLLAERTVVEHSGNFKSNARFDTFLYDSKDNIVGINGRTLKVVDLSVDNKTYFQAWVDGYQNDGLSHNEAVKSALEFAQNDKHSN